MKEIVMVRFRYKGVIYIGRLTNVSGITHEIAYHLSVDSFHWGRLRKTNSGWAFEPTQNTEGLQVLANWFGSKVEG